MRILTAALLALTLGACASMRKVDVGGGDATANAAIEVTNNRSGTISVSYTSEGVTRQLGTVAPRRTERFVIVGAAGSQVTVLALTSAGGSAGSYPVTLEPGTTKRITVR